MGIGFDWVVSNNLPWVLNRDQVRVSDKFAEEFESRLLVSHNECFALTLLPTVTVGCGGGSLQFTVMTFVTHTGTLRAATQRLHQPTTTTFKYIQPNPPIKTSLQLYFCPFELLYFPWKWKDGRMRWFGRAEGEGRPYLIDMFSPSPSETTSVITTQDMKWTVIRKGARRVDHWHQYLNPVKLNTNPSDLSLPQFFYFQIKPQASYGLTSLFSITFNYSRLG